MHKHQHFFKILLLTTLIFSLLGCGNNANEPILQDESSINVETTLSKQSDVFIETVLTGRIQPVETSNIVSIVPGEITSISVHLGQKVEKGDLLFNIDSTQIENQLKQAQSIYEQSETTFNNALTNYTRMQSLLDESAISKQQFEQIELQKLTSQQILTQSKANLDNAQDLFSNCFVTAPISGYITAININEGEIASQSQTSISIANTTKVIIDASVSESMINKIQLGTEVSVLVRSASDEHLKGIISELSPAPAKNSLTYPLKIKIDNASNLIKSGMFAEIAIVSEEKLDVLVVPTDSVIVKGGFTVVGVVEDDYSTFKKVVTGVDNGLLVEILEGLNENENVITKGQNYIDEGIKVTIANQE